MIMHQSQVNRKHNDGNSSEDSNKKVSSAGEDKKELKKMIVDLVEEYTRPTSKIVVMELSASDLTPGTTASEAGSEIKIKCQRGFDTLLPCVIRDKMYTRMKFVKNKNWRFVWLS